MRSGLRPSFRLIFASTIAGLGLFATAFIGLVASQVTGARLRSEIGGDLAELAHHMADTLDRGVYERWRDIQILASLDTIRSPDVPVEAKRIVLERLRQTYPDYAAIGLMEPNGRVLTATMPAMVGADVASREFFVEGSKGPFVGDVHDAILLAKLLGNDPADPPRFVDFSAPVQAADGSLVGVIGAHLYWSWADEMQQALRSAARIRHPEIEVLVLARDGSVLLGPRDVLRTAPDLDAAKAARAGQTGYDVETWPDGIAYLAGYRRTGGYRDYPGLGWSVLVRQRADLSFAPIGELQNRIALWGGLVAILTAVLAWFAAGWIVRPLRLLAQAAERLGQGEPFTLPRIGAREIVQVGEALFCAAEQLAGKERRHALLIAELNHRVKNTLTTVQAMAVITARSASDQDSYKRGLEARIIALSKTHNLLTQSFWEAVSLRDLLSNELEPYDDGHGRRILLDGPVVPVAPRVAVALGMAAHELVTNAVKHGSLSVPGGRVQVRWSLDGDGHRGSRLHLVWKESGGPAVGRPSRQGFGSRLLGQGITRDLDCETHLDFAVEGLGCTLLVSLDPDATAGFDDAPALRDAA